MEGTAGTAADAAAVVVGKQTQTTRTRSAGCRVRGAEYG